MGLLPASKTSRYHGPTERAYPPDLKTWEKGVSVMERRISLKLAAASLSLGLGLIAVPVEAGSGSWNVTGSPSGGDVYQLLVNPTTPSILYVGSGPGVFQSTDSGANWTLVFPTFNPPDALVMDPLDPQTLYVASSVDSTKTLFKTTDGGATWAEADHGIGTVANGKSIDWVSNLALDPVHAGVLYASSGNTGMYKSSDGGAHWAAINTGLSQIIFPDSSIQQLVVDPTNPSIVYLVDVVFTSPGSTIDTSMAGLYKSTDGGQHWHTTGLMTEQVGKFSIDPADHTHLYSCFLTALSDSTDSGATWNPAGSCEPGASATDPSDPQHILAGGFGSNLMQSTDGGANFNAIVQMDGVHVDAIAFDPQNHLNVYASTSAWGVFKSTDGGASWSPSNTGIHNVGVDLMLEGPDGITYLASGDSGIFKSPDQGVTWAQVGTSAGFTGSLPTQGDTVYTLVEDPTANSTLYAGTNFGIFKTIDGGDTWTETDSGIPTPQTLALAIDPEAPSTLYAATNVSGAGVYKSIDGGASWSAAGNGLHYDPSEGGFQALAVDPHHSDVVYAGSFFSGLFKSVDGGASWKPDNGAIGVTDIWSVAVDPHDSNVVYTATSNGFFKSTDAGATWVESDWGLGGYWDMTDIQFDPADSSILYVTQRYGLGDAFVSPDAGYTWYDMSTLTPIGVDSNAVRSVQRQVLPGRINRAFAGGHGSPIQRSTGTVSIRAAAIGPHSSRMLGGSSDGRVYSFDVKNLPKGGHPAAGGGGNNGGGGSGGGGAAGGSSGGGGSFGLLIIFGLLGFTALRRRQ